MPSLHLEIGCQLLASKAKVSDVEEKRCSSKDYETRQSKSPIRHFVRMPATFFPIVSKTIKICSNVSGPEKHHQPERKEADTHYDRCWCIAAAHVVHADKVLLGRHLVN